MSPRCGGVQGGDTNPSESLPEAKARTSVTLSSPRYRTLSLLMFSSLAMSNPKVRVSVDAS